MPIRKKLLTIAAAIALAMPPAAALAAVALAVGTTSDPGAGIAFGYSYNYDSEEEAKRTAMESCRSYEAAPNAAKLCALFGSLKKGCVAMAFDPKDDSPGMGWAVAEKREVAESRAIAACRKVAPSARRQFCKIDTIKCDGDAPPKKE